MNDEDFEHWLRYQAAAAGLDGPNRPYVVESGSPGGRPLAPARDPRAGMPWERPGVPAPAFDVAVGEAFLEEPPPAPPTAPPSAPPAAVAALRPPPPALEPEDTGPPPPPTQPPAPPAAARSAAPRFDTSGAGASDEAYLRSAQRRANTFESLGIVGQALNQAFGDPRYAGSLDALSRSARQPVEDAKDVLGLRREQRGAQERARASEAATARDERRYQETLDRDAARQEFTAGQNQLDREAYATRQSERLEAQAERETGRQEFTAGQQALRLKAMRELAELRRRPRGGGGGGGGGNQATIDARAADLEAAIDGNDFAALARLTSTRAGNHAVSAALRARQMAGVQGRADQGNSRWLAQRLDASNVPALRRYHQAAAQDWQSASDSDIRQTVWALAHDVVPATRLGQSLTAYMQPLRQQTFGATLTGNELQSFRTFVGTRPVDSLDPRKARMLLGRFLQLSRAAVEDEARNLERGAGQGGMDRYNAPTDRATAEPGEATGSGRAAIETRVGRPLTDAEWAEFQRRRNQGAAGGP